jgi:hypothetical protein
MRQRLEKTFLSIFRQQDKALFKFATILVVLTVMGFYFYVVDRYCVNIPFSDDFEFLNFSNKILEKESLEQKFHLFFKFHNEHRIAVPRLVFYIMLKLFSEINFKIAIFLGNISLFGLLILFYKLVPPGQAKWLALAPCALFLFQLQHWENASWAIGALSNFGGVIIAGFSFYFLNRLNWTGFVFSLMFSILALCFNGGGLLIFIAIGIFYLLAKQFKFFKLWLVISLVVFSFYFLDYVKPENHPSVFEAVQHPTRLFLYFVSFIGGSFSTDNHYLAPLAPLGGMVSLIFFAYLTWKKHYLKNPAIYSFMLFILLIGVSAAAFRSGFGIHQAFSSRYKIFSTIYLILTFLTIMELIPMESEKMKATFLGYSAIFALVFNLTSFPRNAYLLNVHTQKLTFNIRHWVMQKEGVPMETKNIDDKIMTKALKSGIYQFSCGEVSLRKQDRAKWCLKI